MNLEEPLNTTKSQTMRFTDHGQDRKHESVDLLEPSFMLADTSDEVQGFFSRPQKIASFDWEPNLGFHQTFNPWSLYFANDKVRERLSNFALLRCRMHVRVMVNATKFYYGRLMLSYRPMHQNDSMTRFRPGEQLDFIEASQRPSVIIDPANDDVGTMTLPYMYPKSALLVPAKEWERMGEMTLADLTVLRNANGATDPVTVTVFAWAENVSYDQPTSLVYTNESGDEFYDGPISKPAHTVARIANHLAEVPIIGIYAKATSMIASAGAAVARMFGYARPTVTDSEHLYAPYFGKRLAVTNAEDTCDPLSLDIKQEIPIDPRVVGAGTEDMMAFVPLAKRETYLTSFQWRVADAPELRLFNIHVTPMQRAYESANIVHTTPAAWIGSLFKYWRGTMKIRFEVVASGFHRGRLRLVYDPIYQETNEYNVNYTHVMDLACETDYTMEIGWAQNIPYLLCDHLNSGNESFSDTTFFSNRLGNGLLTVFVVNSLTTPSETLPDVTVNVYVSMCDDFEVQCPTGRGLEDLGIQSDNDLPDRIRPEDPGRSDGGVEPYAPRGRVVAFGPTGTPPPGFNTMSGIYNWQSPGDCGGVIIGATTDDLNYQFNPFDLTLFRLESRTDNQISLRMRTRNNGGFPSDITINGNVLSWYKIFDTVNPEVYEVLFEDLSADTTSTQYDITFDWPDTTPLTVYDCQAFRSDSGDFVCADDTTGFTKPVNANFVTGNRGGPAWILDPGGSITLANRGTTVSTLSMRNETGISATTDFTVNGINQSFTLTSLEDVPDLFSITGLNITDPEVIIVNNSPDQVGVYNYVWLGPIYENEDKIIYLNEGAEDEQLQSERSEIIENAAGVVTNETRLSSIFFGEVPSSFRQCQRRYTLTRNLGTNAGSRAYGLYANPRDTAAGQIKAADVSLWYWIMAPYLGWKGSIRHKIVQSKGSPGTVTIGRAPDGIIAETSNDLTTNQFINNVGWVGATTGNMQNQICEAVIPWYSNLRFRNCRISQQDTTYDLAPALSLEIAAEEQVQFRQLSAAGEDYQLHFWISTPIVFVRSQ